MRESPLTLIGAVLGAVGTALLLFEGVRAVVMHHILSSTGELLMWVGLGVMAVAGVLLVIGAWEAPADRPAEPAPEA
ncbi:MAG TPA: hypothetical protein VG650_03210 [Mycobacteriales bacterium]|nr:hypothetical protein [Mycobacteriales bacterium]